MKWTGTQLQLLVRKDYTKMGLIRHSHTVHIYIHIFPIWHIACVFKKANELFLPRQLFEKLP